MPTVTRERAMEAPREKVWALARDPQHMPRWWPSVSRVEEADEEAWTALRADYRVLESVEPERLVWRHEIEESPFERIMSDSRYQMVLEPEGEGTRVTLAHRTRLRGFARFGVIQVRLATRKTLERALEGLATLAEGR